MEVGHESSVPDVAQRFILILFTGCSSHHHGCDDRAQSGYWNQAAQDKSGLVEKHVQDPEKAKQVNAVMGDIISEVTSAREQHRQCPDAFFSEDFGAPL